MTYITRAAREQRDLFEAGINFALREETTAAQIAEMGTRLGRRIVGTLNPEVFQLTPITEPNVACAYLDLLRDIYRERREMELAEYACELEAQASEIDAERRNEEVLGGYELPSDPRVHSARATAARIRQELRARQSILA